jgi:pyruvate dehydrogenase phosphatase
MCFPLRTSLTSFRDDLTVEVIFFGEGAATGTVTLNQEASAPTPEVKAKL